MQIYYNSRYNNGISIMHMSCVFILCSSIVHIHLYIRIIFNVLSNLYILLNYIIGTHCWVDPWKWVTFFVKSEVKFWYFSHFLNLTPKKLCMPYEFLHTINKEIIWNYTFLPIIFKKNTKEMHPPLIHWVQLPLTELFNYLNWTELNGTACNWM